MAMVEFKGSAFLIKKAINIKDNTLVYGTKKLYTQFKSSKWYQKNHPFHQILLKS